MTSTLPPADTPVYLERLMRAGQDAVKQFDDALALAVGVRGKEANPPGQSLSPFKLIADVQHEYFTPLWRFGIRLFFRQLRVGRSRTLRCPEVTSV